jgi:hypothetical protein
MYKISNPKANKIPLYLVPISSPKERPSKRKYLKSFLGWFNNVKAHTKKIANQISIVWAGTSLIIVGKEAMLTENMVE